MPETTMKQLNEKIAESAQEFSEYLGDIADLIDADFDKVFRKCCLDAFASIIKRSPVDTGFYRASNDIAFGSIPPSDVVLEVPKKKGKNPLKFTPDIEDKEKKISIGVEKGVVWFFNNTPYAFRIETGWSTKKAPQGVYMITLNEFNRHFAKALSKYDYMGVF